MDDEGSNETLGVGVGGVGLSRFGGSVVVVVVGYELGLAKRRGIGILKDECARVR